MGIRVLSVSSFCITSEKLISNNTELHHYYQVSLKIPHHQVRLGESPGEAPDKSDTGEKASGSGSDEARIGKSDPEKTHPHREGSSSPQKERASHEV